MSTVAVCVPGADPTIIDHEPCGVCETAEHAVTYHTAIPDRNLYVTTWYSWEFERGETTVNVLGEKRCERCHREHLTPRTGRPSLYCKTFRSDQHVSRGGLGEWHIHVVQLAVGNRLPDGR